MNAVETLREAARLMRERAEAATPGPWSATPGDDTYQPTVHAHHNGGWIAECGPESDGLASNARGMEDAAHIASWHPAVALAVADWIGGHAADLESANGRLPRVAGALAVARAYLEEA